MSIEVRPVKTKKELMTFIKLPFKLYENDPNWVAPLVMEEKKTFNSEKNPFYDHSDVQLFVAYKDGKPVGRITAHIDHNYNEFHDEKNLQLLDEDLK